MIGDDCTYVEVWGPKGANGVRERTQCLRVLPGGTAEQTMAAHLERMGWRCDAPERPVQSGDIWWALRQVEAGRVVWRWRAGGKRRTLPPGENLLASDFTVQWYLGEGL